MEWEDVLRFLVGQDLLFSTLILHKDAALRNTQAPGRVFIWYRIAVI